MTRILSVFSLLIAAISLLAAPISAKAPAAVMFGKHARIHDAALSPDASELAVVESVGGKWVIRVLNLSQLNQRPRIVSIGDDVQPQWIKWANNDHILLSITRRQKREGTPIKIGMLYSLNAKSMTGKFLIKPKNNKDSFRQFNNRVADFLPDDPDHILMIFSDSETNNAEPGVKRVNVATGRYSVVTGGQPDIQSWDADRTGTVRVGTGLYESTSGKLERKMIVREAGSNKWQNAKKFPSLDPDARVHGFTSNPNEMIVTTRREGRDTKGLYIYDLSKKSYSKTLFENDTYDASGVVTNSDGDVIGARYTAEKKEVKLFGDNATALSLLRQKHKGFNVDYIDQSEDNNTLIYRLSNAYDPGYLMMVKKQTMKEDVLAAYREDLPNEKMGLVTSVKYTARDGAKIPAFVTIPPMLEGKKLDDVPFIILPHGGPYARTSKRFNTFSQFFASRGYGVLRMNFRGSSGYGEKFETAGRDNWVLMLNDVEDGARWLIEKGYTSPDKLCVGGWSFGGYAALMEAIEHPELYSCALSVAGVTDLDSHVRDRKRYRFGELYSKKSILSGFENQKDMKTHSPARRASEMKIPTFLAHGTEDQAVRFSQYTYMKNSLKKSSAKLTAIEFEGDGHSLSNQDNSMRLYQEMDKFLTKHMGVSPYMAK